MRRYRYKATTESSANEAAAATVQRKLNIGNNESPLEKEADATANMVMRIPENSLVQRKAAGPAGEFDDEHVRLKPLGSQVSPYIQTKGDGGGMASPAVTNGIKATQGGGGPMTGATKSFMESRFGVDFSDVKIHTGEYAAQLSNQLNAQAFTVGSDIYFNTGKYAPGASDGNHLLAHELTHVLQQSNSIERKIQRQPDNKTAKPIGPPANKQDEQPAHTPEKQPAEPPQVITMKDKVRAWLDSRDFDIPMAADSSAKPKDERRVHYKNRLWTIENVTSDTVLSLHLSKNDEAQVRAEIVAYYDEKKEEAENKKWTLVVQGLYTPQITLATNQPPATTQHSFQLAVGGNRRYHPAGANGFEMTYQGSLGLFNLGTGTSATAGDAFQNLMLAAQAQYVWNLGHDFRVPFINQWANIQASLFGQLAAGVGSNWTDEGAERKVYLGVLIQPAAGGQVNLNIGSAQVIFNGQLVGSFLSPTYQPKSSWINSVGVQFGVGLGGQF